MPGPLWAVPSPPCPAAAPLGTSSGTSPGPFPVTPHMSSWGSEFSPAKARGWRFPTLGTLIRCREVTRTAGQHGTAVGHCCVGHLAVPWNLLDKAAPRRSRLHPPPVTPAGSALARGDSGHGHPTAGHGAWGSWGLGRGWHQPRGQGGPPLGWEQHRGGRQCCHPGGAQAGGCHRTQCHRTAPSWGDHPLLPQFPQKLPAPPGEASDSQAGRAASGEGFIDSRLGVQHSLSSLPASAEDVALDFPGKSARRGFTVSSLRESRTEAVTNGKRYVV